MNAVDTLAAALRGDRLSIDGAAWDDIVDTAEAHRVDALLSRAPAAASAPPAVRSRLHAMAAGGEAVAAAMDRELAGVLAQLASGGVCPVVIKGAHLSHTIYASPGLRPRGDADLVIAEDEQARLTELLHRAAYRRRVHVRGSIILGQCHFERTDDLGLLHALDVHWRLAAPLVFRRVLPPASLHPSSVPLPPLGSHAAGPRRSHALLIACIHLVAHHRHDPLLLWLYDIAGLAQAFDERDGIMFVDTAVASGVSAVCADALNHARRYFDGPALTSLAMRAATAARARNEASARVLTTARTIDDAWLDFRVAEGWRERVALLREHILPDVEYMRATRGGAGWLPLGYARRALSGAWKWMAPKATGP